MGTVHLCTYCWSKDCKVTSRQIWRFEKKFFRTAHTARWQPVFDISIMGAGVPEGIKNGGTTVVLYLTCAAEKLVML